MANFAPIKDQIIPIEGGYVFNKNDPGGETKYGISKRSYPHLDIKNLTLDEANDIYKRDFWNVMKLDQVNDQTIAEKVFWFGVHSGPVTSIKCLQKALNSILSYCGITLNVDGINGYQTIYNLNNFINNKVLCGDVINNELKIGATVKYYDGVSKTQCEFLLNSLKLEQIQYYVNIVNAKPSSREFLLGWINRALKG